MDRLSRRRFLGLTLGGLAVSLAPGALRSDEPGSTVELGQLLYKGGQWLPRASALRRLAWELHKRTAVRVGLEPPVVHLRVEELRRSPFLYLAGDRPFGSIERRSLDALGRFLAYGGFLLIDTAHTVDGDAEGFLRSCRRLIASLPLGEPLKPLPPQHVLYRSFYVLDRPIGRVEGPDHLEGVTLGGRTAVILSDHDLGGAWAKDNFGNWEYEVTPGGQRQREAAFRLGINLVIYSLCLDYKDEKPHQRFLERKGQKP